MAQEAFVKVYSNLKSFDRARPFKPWLLRIASNAAISELRRQSKVVSLNAMEEEGAWHEADFQQTEDTLTSLERQLSGEEVAKAMAKLDEKYRSVLLLRYQQDLRYEEIAESLELPLNTVRTRIKRGLEKLKATIQEGSCHG
jgi:RNA polymerase sigma-70 factor (ECF subfamily)